MQTQKNSNDTFDENKSNRDYNERLNAWHKLCAFLGIIVVVLLLIIAYCFSNSKNNTVIKEKIVPCKCTEPKSNPTPCPATPHEPWSKTQTTLTDPNGNKLAELSVFTISKEYQWALGKDSDLQNKEETLFKLINNDYLKKQFTNTHFIIAVGLASYEGATDAPDSQINLAQQRANFLAATINEIEKPPVSLLTLNLGYFKPLDGATVASHLQRSIVILGITKSQTGDTNIQTDYLTELSIALKKAFNENANLLPSILNVENYSNFENLTLEPYN